MATKENIHAGHRKRLRERFLKHPDSFSDHELLELLLCSFLPRVNTNALAHTLLFTFGSLENIFLANKEELLSITGIGENTATQILVFGEIYRKAFCSPKDKKQAVWISYRVYSKEIRNYFDDFTSEKLIVFFLDKKFVPFFHAEFTDKMLSRVNVDTRDLANLIALKKPAHIIVAHNHPSGNCLPSDTDDDTALQIAAICTLPGCGFGDNLIFTKNDCYSYKNENRFDKLVDLSKYKDFLIEQKV
ncbi:MAG: JAB domain-containing protein [Clostridia bacterium]|nr:JAB domain-containing protein [Clostridia bacterium]